MIDMEHDESSVKSIENPSLREGHRVGYYAIILGGGKGLRMGADIPKQFLEVGGLPILMRTILRFREYDSWAKSNHNATRYTLNSKLKIILVLPKEQQEFWHELCEQHHFEEEYEIADGGSERFFSIKNALALIPDDAEGVVAVHDGVRPFPSVEVIARCFETARQTGTAVPVVPVVETLRKVEAHPQPLPKGGEFDANTPGIATNQNPSLREGHRVGSITVPRSEYRLVQTPQAFDIQLHKKAYRQPFNNGFTDDASVVEAYLNDVQACNQNPSLREGHRVGSITLVEGNRENIKITTPFDLLVAEAIVKLES